MFQVFHHAKEAPSYLGLSEIHYSVHTRLRNDLYCVEWDVKP